MSETSQKQLLNEAQQQTSQMRSSLFALFAAGAAVIGIGNPLISDMKNVRIDWIYMLPFVVISLIIAVVMMAIYMRPFIVPNLADFSRKKCCISTIELYEYCIHNTVQWNGYLRLLQAVLVSAVLYGTLGISAVFVQNEGTLDDIYIYIVTKVVPILFIFLCLAIIWQYCSTRKRIDASKLKCLLQSNALIDLHGYRPRKGSGFCCFSMSRPANSCENEEKDCLTEEESAKSPES